MVLSERHFYIFFFCKENRNFCVVMVRMVGKLEPILARLSIKI